MKKFITSKGFLALLALTAGWAFTWYAVDKKISFITGGTTYYASSFTSECYACYVPEDGLLYGSESAVASSAQEEANKFKELSESLDSETGGSPLWKIKNRGGYIDRNVLKTLLGSLSDEETKVGYYFGLKKNVSGDTQDFLSLIFIKGNRNCDATGLSPEESDFQSKKTIHTIFAGTTSDSTPVMCPPNCPDYICPSGCPELGVFISEPGSIPSPVVPPDHD